MRVLLVIPARIGSTRLPEKPLRSLAGEPLIHHTVRQALTYRIDAEIVVATDDERVVDAVAPLGVRAVMTELSHQSGTERVAEVARRSEYRDVGVVVNLQGDEPFFPASPVAAAVRQITSGEPLVTVGHPLAADALSDRNRVKVGVDDKGYARWFSRDAATVRGAPGVRRVLQHVGLYAYTREALFRWTGAPAVPGERSEALEQLRPLALGMTMRTVVLDAPTPPSVDTMQDLEFAESQLVANGCM